MRSPSPIAAGVTSAEWEALGTGVVLRVTDRAGLAAARGSVEAELAAIDLACSRFRSDSELSRLNAGAGRRVRVGPLLLEALEVALRAAQLTDGDVDPTIGRALELAGYDRDWRLLSPPEEPSRPREVTVVVRLRSGWRTVSVDRATSSVLLPAGVRLDLGATAKAWAADRAAAAAAEAAGCGVLVGIGGDIATCGPPPEGGWQIRVTDDHRSPPSAPGQTVSIRAGGLATSSTAVRRWSHAGRTMHHIIDPATGMPVLGDLAHGQRRRRELHRRQHREHRRARAQAAAPGWLAALRLPARLVGWNEELVHVGGWPAEGAAALGSADRGGGTDLASGRRRRDGVTARAS